MPFPQVTIPRTARMTRHSSPQSPTRHVSLDGLCPHAVSIPEPFPSRTTCECLCAEEGQAKRKLVVCIDGASNKFSATTSNVAEIFSHLIKDKDQLAYYGTGIGTLAVTSPSSLYHYKHLIRCYLDMAFARNVGQNIMNAYQWLAENYEEGDVVYMFGFSAGAYQVRALAAMIERVGLVYKGNISQIPLAYEMYLDQQPSKRESILSMGWKLHQIFIFIIVTLHLLSTRGFGTSLTPPYIAGRLAWDSQRTAFWYHIYWQLGLASIVGVLVVKALYKIIFRRANVDNPERTAELDQLAARFKELCAREIKIHFVGCWDTVSSVGFLRPRTLPLASSTKHICFFRHALALHEQRVKFLPEYFQFSESSSSSISSNSPFKDFVTADFVHDDIESVKEVWFAGTHSDLGAIPYELRDNPLLPAPLRWMLHESSKFGLRFKPSNDRSPRSFSKFQYVGTNGTGKPKLKCDLCPGGVISVVPSRSLVWKMLEYLPVTQPHYVGLPLFGFHLPHRGAGRVIQPGQRIHYSVQIYLKKGHAFPPARFSDPTVKWESFLEKEHHEFGKPDSPVTFDSMDEPPYDMDQPSYVDWKVFRAADMAERPWKSKFVSERYIME